jgi:hypothetical protein
MEEFARVFGSAANVVVVLFREGWGHTPWTRVEQGAIQDRGFQAGWDFLICVCLDGVAVPAWLPKQRLWLNWGRFGLAGLCAVVEQRLADVGSAPKMETVAELATRRRREQAIEAGRVGLLRSAQGVALADSAARDLLDEIARLAQDIEREVSIAVERRADDSIWLFRAGHTIGVHWHRAWLSTLDESGLVVEVHRGRVGPGRYANLRTPEMLSEWRLAFNVDADLNPLWQSQDEGKVRLSSRGLAERVVKSALSLTAPRTEVRELGRRRRRTSPATRFWPRTDPACW